MRHQSMYKRQKFIQRLYLYCTTFIYMLLFKASQNKLLKFLGTFILVLFRLFLYRLFKSTTTQRRSRHSTDTVKEFHAEAPQSTASEGLAHGQYLAARAGFKPATLRSKGNESANEPPRPTIDSMLFG